MRLIKVQNSEKLIVFEFKRSRLNDCMFLESDRFKGILA